QSFTDQSHNTTFYGYNLNPRHLLTTITDPRGITVLTNTWSGNQLQHTQDSATPNKNQVSYNLNTAANQETIVDRNFNSTTYTYDDDGNVTAVLDALGHTTSYTYDAAGNKQTETKTDDNGKQLITTFDYDDHSNLKSETDPMGHVTRYEYNARKQVTKITD